MPANTENTLLAESSQTAPNPTAVNLDAPGVAAQLARRIADDIDKYCTEAYYDGHRWHLGASLIGHSCSRYLWLLFRWAFEEIPEPRVLRLFNRGHREEARYVEYLRGIGCTVHTEDKSKPPKENGEYPQYRIEGSNGHFGGSLDAIIALPERYNYPYWILGEFKTNGTGSSWEKLKKQTMIVAKPQHYAQTSTYGGDPTYNFNHVLYMNVNKNDDDLHIELARLDISEGQRMRAKADRIINSELPPQRLSENPTYFECKYCPAVKVCHGGEEYKRNCRSCMHAVPIEGAEWGCRSHGVILPRDFILQGCDRYRPIPHDAS